jgi:hypothetical protein
MSIKSGVSCSPSRTKKLCLLFGPPERGGGFRALFQNPLNDLGYSDIGEKKKPRNTGATEQ